MPKRLTETTPLSEAGIGTLTNDGRMPVQAISAGKGSSGTYSAAILEKAADDKLIDEGTPLYFDHPSATERHDRPERSVRDIAAVFTGPATYDATREALIGEIQVFTPYRELVSEMAPYIGLSIHGSATDIVSGVVEGLATIDSVDLVTRAGRGGMFLFESARPGQVVERAIGHGIDEATANETREQLQQALRDTFGGEKSWLWVRDFDDDTVWFEHETPDSSGVYALAYSTGDSGVELSNDDPTEVRATTTYVPVTRPGGTSITTEESKEDTPMGNKTIEESEYARLTEAAGRVDTLQQERDTAIAERDNARGELAEHRRTEAAAKIVDEKATAASVTFTALESTGLLAGLPVKDDGTLDVDDFTKTVESQVAEKQKAAGVGTVTGFGARHTATPDGAPVGESTPRTRTAWGRETQKGA